MLHWWQHVDFVYLKYFTFSSWPFFCIEGRKQTLLKHQLTFIISVFWFWSWAASVYRRYGGYCLFCVSKLRISISHRVVLVCRNILNSLLFTYLLQYPVSWWDWERGLDLMFKSQAGLLWPDREKVLIEETDTAQRTKTITVHPPLWSRRTAAAVVGNVCEE